MLATEKPPVPAKLENLIAQLGSGNFTLNALFLSEIAESLASLLGVKADEVAVLGLTSDHLALRFLLPAALQGSGIIPVQSNVAVAARAFRLQTPVILNAFASEPHARIFETMPAKPEAPPIQKIIAVPLFQVNRAIGVAEISRKGDTPQQAGPDFNEKDVSRVQAANGLLAQLAISTKIVLPQEPKVGIQQSNRGTRREPRVHMDIPVIAIYANSQNAMVREETRTLVVSAYGAALVLKNPPSQGHSIVLIHGKSGEEAFCRVTNTRQIPKSTDYEVGIGFLDPRPRFWRIVFPSPEWDPSERKRVSSK
jgi:hypothetical protein